MLRRIYLHLSSLVLLVLLPALAAAIAYPLHWLLVKVTELFERP